MIKRIALCAALVVAPLFALAGDVSAEAKKVQKTSLSFEDREIRMSGFSGSKIKVGALWNLDQGCKSTQPDVRIVKAPKGGEVTVEEMHTPLILPEKHVSYRCNGTRVNGATIFYESKDDFSGSDQFKLEVDYKQGTARSYTVYMNIR